MAVAHVTVTEDVVVPAATVDRIIQALSAARGEFEYAPSLTRAQTETFDKVMRAWDDLMAVVERG